MAEGRRDYTWGFLNEAATEGRYTENFVEVFSVPIASLDTANLLLYVVPSDYKLAVNRIEICTTSRFVNGFRVTFGSLDTIYLYFSDNYSFAVSDQNPIYLSEGEILLIEGVNLDSIVATFNGCAVGVLEALIS